MNTRPAPLSELPADNEVTAAGPSWPEVQPTTNLQLDLMVQHHLTGPTESDHAFGHLEVLAKQLACIQHSDQSLQNIRFEAPQLVVFAADHGIADEGVSAFPQEVTKQRALALLTGKSHVNALADLHGFAVTLVDAGVGSHIQLPPDTEAAVPLLLRKIGYGTRNMVITQAMSVAQARAAIVAGMDVVRHLPGNVVALSNIGVAGNASAAQLLSRLCGVPLADACGKDMAQDEVRAQRKLERLFAAASRHRKATAPLDVLAAMGGFEIAMLCGAILQAASERRVVLLDGFVAGAAALVARSLVPASTDYMVFAQRSAEPGHRLLLIHMQATPLLDMNLRTGQGAGALLAWPLLLAAQRLIER
ncbi:nicotinate-nucleotide--dimethylbenzimidazole phosphoribosyltransferase [Hydrogenophaga sp. RWCD_12]|uniref:nicotinate-nucleotide--dimethylbenzimidazole phosphoribosyltransferase n=1 Tax=Hydrogenophaga sp. RWCD_12 TaxID=3391190 RepID=UPI0039848F37